MKIIIEEALINTIEMKPMSLVILLLLSLKKFPASDDIIVFCQYSAINTSEQSLSKTLQLSDKRCALSFPANLSGPDSNIIFYNYLNALGHNLKYKHRSPKSFTLSERSK